MKTNKKAFEISISIYTMIYFQILTNVSRTMEAARSSVLIHEGRTSVLVRKVMVSPVIIKLVSVGLTGKVIGCILK